jgi:SAM-dependent methyltransferase
LAPARSIKKGTIMKPLPTKEPTNHSPDRLPFWDPRKALEYPPIYNLFQRAVGADKPRRAFIAEHIAPLGRARVLEIGCGPATNCAWMPQDIEYVGCDHNEAYIAYARNRYGNRAEFFSVPVGQLRDLGLKPFNAVIALALLHHLTDAEVLTLCDEVLPLLGKSGSLITGDPCFVTGMKRLERFITSCDRGQYVRYPEQYRELLASRFPIVDMEVRRSRGMAIPNTGVVIKASLS